VEYSVDSALDAGLHLIAADLINHVVEYPGGSGYSPLPDYAVSPHDSDGRGPVAVWLFGVYVENPPQQIDPLLSRAYTGTSFNRFLKEILPWKIRLF
jgi:hypothetical protein